MFLLKWPVSVCQSLKISLMQRVILAISHCKKYFQASPDRKTRRGFVFFCHALVWNLSSTSIVFLTQELGLLFLLCAGGREQSNVPEAAAEGHHPCRDAKTHQVPVTAGEHRQVHWYHSIDVYLHRKTYSSHLYYCSIHTDTWSHSFLLKIHIYLECPCTTVCLLQAYCISLLPCTNTYNDFTPMHAFSIPSYPISLQYSASYSSVYSAICVYGVMHLEQCE